MAFAGQTFVGFWSMTEKWRTYPWGNMGSVTHVVGTHDFLAEVRCIPSWHLLCKSTLGGFKRIKKSKIFLDFRRKLETLFIKIELAKDFIRPKGKIAIATLTLKLSIPQRTPTQSQKRVSETVFFFFLISGCILQIPRNPNKYYKWIIYLDMNRLQLSFAKECEKKNMPTVVAGRKHRNQ